MITRRELFFAGLAGGLVLLLVGCAIALGFVPYLATEPPGHAEPGCHLTGDQLVFGASCHGIRGEQAAEILLSLPFALVLVPLAGMNLISEAGAAGDIARSLLGMLALFFGLSLWAPFVYLGALLRRLTQPRAIDKV